MKRVAILISGSGSNMLALVRNMTGAHPGRPVLVLASDPGAAGLAKAADAGVPTAAVDASRYRRDRTGFEAAVGGHLDAAAPDLVCLAGFMRILSPGFVRRWQGRILNIHPSLLPLYPGLDTHARALAASDSWGGCTVHHVTEVLDGGPILGQARVGIRPDDTPLSLADRVLEAEHALYPAVVQRVLSGDAPPLRLRDRT